MIEKIQENDFDVVCDIVNNNWKVVYKGLVSDELLNESSCMKRSERLKEEFKAGKLANYVYKEEGKAVALLTIGDTEEKDKAGSFEVWRIYIKKEQQNKGIGQKLLQFAEGQAKILNKKEIVIWAFKENKRAVSFYKKHGYVIDKEKYLGEPYCAYGIRFNKKIIIIDGQLF